MNPRLKVSPSLQSNKGLVLDKFITLKQKKDDSYKAPLLEVAKMDSGYSAYKMAYERWVRVTKDMPFAVRVKATVRGRLAIGLGAESVTEIGCKLHATYGVPIIPGSSIKGVLRAGMTAGDGENPGKWTEQADFLFGTEQNRGYATVHDAWWVPRPGSSGLSLDVLTSHHSDYYTGSKPVAPTDFDDPIPNYFLTVSGEFLFQIHAPNKSWQVFVEQLLQQVLSENGIGAKKSSGYGRFVGLTVQA